MAKSGMHGLILGEDDDESFVNFYETIQWREIYLG